jgi:hypothetical protein
MARNRVKHTFHDTEIEIRQASRADRAKQNILFSAIVVKVADMMALKGDLELYIHIVTQTDIKTMTTLDGDKFKVPLPEATVEDHIQAFRQFQQTEIEATDALGDAIAQCNRGVVARHVLPDGELTEAEKDNPSSLSVGRSSKQD